MVGTRIGIIIPAFNEEPNVAEALRRASVVLQTLNLEYEIILVNDGSFGVHSNQFGFNVRAIPGQAGRRVSTRQACRA
jgi:cellulose synthase/poly-beta-1,6-N-acetylglucosamine synthase-like glycosyltransferase